MSSKEQTGSTVCFMHLRDVRCSVWSPSELSSSALLGLSRDYRFGRRRAKLYHVCILWGLLHCPQTPAFPANIGNEILVS